MDNLYNFLTSYGIIVPDTDDIKSGIQEGFKNALGSDLSLEEATPQGRLIDAMTLSHIDTLRVCSLVANMINPNLSFGSFLDNICALTGCERKLASSTRVTVKLTGTPLTFVPANTLASTSKGDVFYLENDIILDENGEAIAIFLSQEKGAIECPANSLANLKTSVIGLETINNPTDGVVGRDVESDSELKLRRLSTLYSGRGFIGDIQSRLANIDNVKSYVVDQNNRNTTLIKDNVEFKPHSVYVCVYGGSNDDIAKALYETVPVGCDYTGNTVVSVNDPYNGKTYEVAFTRPEIIEIDVKIYVRKNSGTGDVTNAIKQSIIDYQDGKVENIDGLEIGEDVSPFEIASAVNIKTPGVFVKDVLIAKHGGELVKEAIEININQIANININNVVVRYV